MDFFIEFINNVVGAISDSFGLIGVSIGEFSTSHGTQGINYLEFAQKFSPVMTAFAYPIAVIFVGLHVIENATNAELFTAKGGIKIAVRLLLAKFWIDLSVTICTYIIAVAGDMTTAIVNTVNMRTSDIFSGFDARTVAASLNIPGADLPLIGDVIASAVGIPMLLMASAPMMLVATAAGIISLVVMCKLLLVTFDITILLAVAPLGFACYASDVTKDYFKKFIVAFISCSFQVVFMAIIYAVGAFAIAEMTKDPLMMLTGQGPISVTWLAVLLAVGIKICSPPKILTGLVS